MNNPFNITKAFDFTDEEINDYWVDLGNDGFRNILTPNDPMSLFILGGKGCGKTHVMRYHSYYLQKLRCEGSLLTQLSKNGYIGVYFTSSGLNTSRFLSKDNIEVDSAAKLNELFIYYMEIWFAQGVVSIFEDLSNSTVDAFQEEFLCKEICKLFDKEPSGVETFKDLLDALKIIQKNIDITINNYPFTGKLDGVEILVSRGNLIFGIPHIITQNVNELRNCKFIYLIDEFENFYEMQQKYINTLLREKKQPVTFRIGSRKHGIKTESTFCGDEENQKGSEYRSIYLDKILRENREYNEFSRKLITKRLRKAGFFSKTDEKPLENYFEQYPEAVENWMLGVISESKEKERKYFKKLKGKITEAYKSKWIILVSEDEIESIIDTLRVKSNPLLEKTNIHLFYAAWSRLKDKENLFRKAVEISKRCQRYQEDSNSEKVYKECLMHYRQDFIAQFCREYKQPGRNYLGLKVYIDMSQGVPRNLLNILKEIYSWAIQNGEHPFQEGKISITSQIHGVEDAAEGFWKTARIDDGKDAIRDEVMTQLAGLFREIRYSDKPSECSLCAFSYNPTKCSQEIVNQIEDAEKVSLLIEIPKGRPDKNSMKVDRKYQLNSMLAVRWKLPTYRRGDLRLSTEAVQAIFSVDDEQRYLRYKKERVARMNAPRFGKKLKKENTLF